MSPDEYNEPLLRGRYYFWLFRKEAAEPDAIEKVEKLMEALKILRNKSFVEVLRSRSGEPSPAPSAKSLKACKCAIDPTVACPVHQ